MIFEIILLLLFFLFFWFLKRKDKLPPGPWSLPYIGSLPLMNVQQCLKMQKKYGNLFMIRVGAYNFLYILDYKLAKEAYFKPEFANRPEMTMFQLLEGERDQGKTNGIDFSNGALWHHNRRFLLRHLRDLGMGKSRMEGVIMREVEDLIEDFKLLIDKPTTLPLSLNIAILNIIWQLLASHRYEFSDKKVKDLILKVDEIQQFFIRVGIPDFFPVLKYVMPESLLNRLTKRELFQKWTLDFPFIDDHLAKLDPDNPVDLMDDYLIEMKAKKSEEFSHFNLTDHTRILFDLITAGNDTTANMVRWVLLYLTKFRSVQEKIQEEIDKVVERDSFPGLEHRDKLVMLIQKCCAVH